MVVSVLVTITVPVGVTVVETLVVVMDVVDTVCLVVSDGVITVVVGILVVGGVAVLRN